MQEYKFFKTFTDQYFAIFIVYSSFFLLLFSSSFLHVFKLFFVQSRSDLRHTMIWKFDFFVFKLTKFWFKWCIYNKKRIWGEHCFSRKGCSQKRDFLRTRISFSSPRYVNFYSKIYPSSINKIVPHYPNSEYYIAEKKLQVFIFKLNKSITINSNLTYSVLLNVTLTSIIFKIINSISKPPSFIRGPL